jgi:aspartyl/asparaginyl-tRNA synthetase
MKVGQDGTFTNFNIIISGLEICGGGMRETNYSRLTSALKDENLEVGNYKKYRSNISKMPPHGGFGLGLNRMLLLSLGGRSVVGLLPQLI